MTTYIGYCIAALGAAVLSILWFQRAEKILRARKHVLERAETQLFTLCDQYAKVRDDPDAKDTLKRSLVLYRQSQEHYNKTLQKPWFFIPGMFLGFRRATDERKQGLDVRCQGNTQKLSALTKNKTG